MGVRGGTQLLGRVGPSARRLVTYGPDSGSGAVAAGAVPAHDVDTVWRLPLPW